MKIKTNTADALVAGARTVGATLLFAPLGLGFVWLIIYAIPQRHPIWVYLLLTFFAAILLLIAFLGLRREQIVFDRKTRRVEIRHKTIAGYQRHAFDLGHVARVDFALPRFTTARTPETAPDYLLDLVITGGMDAGNYLIAVAPLPRERAIELRDTMNAWLKAAA
ncbi:hypothetical protein Q4555_07065 [Octadecabacter sp. 1_MG-2023]|uniref:hypothetical protein n=1 Tax=unclassified Octadecabacter TaxID=196158 RepID=UPI001C0A09AE|nr:MULTISPECIES: hypothetical protein [unclassified Octadecabacter]MBU2994288.1 hypothetical protein [Octadecabacter sp. B2R22]MDO6734423.1 hypothetical protein [Octadecabacter sp. 1_MG-2023]